MFRRFLSVSGFTLLSRITGFIRDILQAAILGAGPLSDAFFVAFLFPSYFRSLFGEGTINPAFLPRYAALHARGEKEAAAGFADAVFSWQMAVQIVVLIAALWTMPFVVRILAPGFDGNPGQIALTAHLSRITFPYLILTVVVVQLSAMLNALEKFAAAAAWSILLNLTMIAALFASAWFPNAAVAAAWGVLAGGVAQLVFIFIAARRAGLALRLSLPRWTPEIAEFFKAFAAVTFGATSVLIAPFIDMLLASLLASGSLTALYYANRIDQLPLGVLGIALGTVLLPEMSAKLALGDVEGSDAAQNKAATLSLLSVLPFAMAFVVIPNTIMQAIFAHGHFDAHAAGISAVALGAYGVGLPAFAMVRILASTFYARHDTFTPARITAVSVAANIALKVVLVWGLSFGIGGIALGTSFGAWVNVATLLWLGRRRGLLHIGPQFRRALPAILIAAAATALGAWTGRLAGMALLPTGSYRDLAALGFAIVLGGAGYFSSVALFRERLPLGRLSRRNIVAV
ncbi:MAG: murein biosynthesis integral membrane protein MurJ [Rhizomicrobium sp.]